MLEVRPDMEWDKGHALNYLLDNLGLGASSDVLPIYIGDDRTDEDAFEVSTTRFPSSTTLQLFHVCIMFGGFFPPSLAFLTVLVLL